MVWVNGWLGGWIDGWEVGPAGGMHGGMYVGRREWMGAGKRRCGAGGRNGSHVGRWEACWGVRDGIGMSGSARGWGKVVRREE